VSNEIEVSYQDQSGNTYYVGTEQIKRTSRAIVVSHYPDEGAGSGFETILLGDIGTREQPGPFVDALFRLVEKVKARQAAAGRAIEIGEFQGLDYRLRVEDGGIKAEVRKRKDGWKQSQNKGEDWESWLESVIRHPLVVTEQGESSE